MDTGQLIRFNRRPRKQKGQRIETDAAFFLRFYTTTDTGARRKVLRKLADKSDKFRSWGDVEHLIAQHISGAQETKLIAPTGSTTLADYVEHTYQPWCKDNLAAASADSYKRLWVTRWKSHVGNTALVNLNTATVTQVLTDLAKQGFSGPTLSHTKWFLSGIYQHAAATGIVKESDNPVPAAKWLCKVKRTRKQREYSLAEVKTALAILEPLDLRAAVAVALAYFTALRPGEIRGLRWPDYETENAELYVRRSVWRKIVGETKTEGSDGSVPVIEPLRGLLEKLRVLPNDGGYILANANHKPLSLNSLNTRVITPALKKAGFDWRGYYPGRRGISSLVTHTSKDALNSTGLLRHSTPITALRHYTRAQKDEVKAALQQIEVLATKKEETAQ